MDVRLLVAHPSAETKQIRLGAETLIGRGPDCKLRISSGQVSRRHCLIKVADASVSDHGRTTEHDISIDPGETIFDVLIEDRPDPLNPGAVKLGERAQAEKASETHLLFEEDDLQRLVADVESAATVNSPAGPQGAETASERADDARTGGQPAGRGLLGFLRRKKKPENSGPATPTPPDDSDDQLRKFLSDV